MKELTLTHQVQNLLSSLFITILNLRFQIHFKSDYTY